MIGYEQRYKIVSHDEPLDFTALCELSSKENMLELDRQSILGHAYGRAIVKTSDNSLKAPEVVSYAGVTGFEVRDGNKLAVVGGILTLLSERSKGHGLAVVRSVCDLALTQDALDLHGHVGLVAKCNKESRPLTKRLGFTEVDFQMDKYVMLRMA